MSLPLNASLPCLAQSIANPTDHMREIEHQTKVPRTSERPGSRLPPLRLPVKSGPSIRPAPAEQCLEKSFKDSLEQKPQDLPQAAFRHTKGNATRGEGVGEVLRNRDYARRIRYSSDPSRITSSGEISVRMFGESFAPFRNVPFEEPKSVRYTPCSVTSICPCRPET